LALLVRATNEKNRRARRKRKRSIGASSARTRAPRMPASVARESMRIQAPETRACRQRTTGVAYWRRCPRPGTSRGGRIRLARQGTPLFRDPSLAGPPSRASPRWRSG
jgi:hypothetical protein